MAHSLGFPYDLQMVSVPFLLHPTGAVAQPNVFQPAVLTNTGIPPCCENGCGRPIPLIVNGNYQDPNGEGRTYIRFNMSTTPGCGIPVARVLESNLDGLHERDDRVELNPNSGSMRLKIEVSDLPPSGPPLTDLRRKWPGYDGYIAKVSMRAKHPHAILARLILGNADKYTSPEVHDGGPCAQSMHAD